MSITIEACTPLVQVFDMPRSVAFYCDVLGFTVLSRSQPGEEHFDWCLLQSGTAELMLNTAYERHDRPPAADPARIVAHGDTELYFACRDLDAAYTHLRGRGVEADPPTVTTYGMKQLRLEDPDGYVICFQWRAA